MQINTQNESCLGANDGELIADCIGGTQPYTYQWLDGSTPLGQNSIVSNLTASPNYQLQVIDANGCPGISCEIISDIGVELDSIIPFNCCKMEKSTHKRFQATTGTTYSWSGPSCNTYCC